MISSNTYAGWNGRIWRGTSGAIAQGKIKAQTRTNLVQKKKYSERLIEALRKYHNRMIETAQVIEEMIQMARDCRRR